MRDAYIIGVGQTAVGRHNDLSLRVMAARAVEAAMHDAGAESVEGLYVGNMLSGVLLNQQHLGALIADAAGLRGIDAATAEAACGSGGAAVRWGVMAIASGQHDIVAVCGVEKLTATDPRITTRGLAMAADYDEEASHGVSFVALNAMIMRRYLYEYNLIPEDLAYFPINAHHNGARNPNAMFQKAVDMRTYRRSPVVADPIRVLDASPICDGAAALIICSGDRMAEIKASGRPFVRVLASANATDSVAVHSRATPMFLQASYLSSRRAYAQAGLEPQDINFFEAHDAFSVMAALSLEACGFAGPGKAHEMAKEGEITTEGRLPMSTMGGLKARGHPVGATGVYQVVEAYLQLTGRAGPNQVQNAAIGMTQNIGGSGATVATHILQRMN
ncbi:MAG: thiolase domain-containing protein [Anaerolineae bacterium]